jgi:hypothetical protein
VFIQKFHRLSSAAGFAAAAICACAGLAAAQEFQPGKVLVGVDDSASEEHVRGLASAVRGSVLRSFTASRVHVLSVPKGSELSMVSVLKGLDHVRYAEPNYIYHLQNLPQPNDPLFNQQWNLSIISAAMQGWSDYPNCWSCQGNDANGPIVAIVDSGIDLTNPDLASRAQGYPDVRGHGTHVAGIIAAAANDGVGIAGLAFNVRQLLSYRACDSSGSCANDDVVNSIEAADAAGATVINLSFGGPEASGAVCDAINASPAVVVVAAGNNGVIGLSYPAACSAALAVSASDSSDNIASFSNGSDAGNFLVAAPGVNVMSTLPTNPNLALNSPTGFGLLSGTSMAAPHVAALVALIQGINPTIGWSTIRDLIAQNADKVGGTYGFNADQICPISNPCSWNNRFGYGRINVARTLTAALAQFGSKPQVTSVTLNAGPITGNAFVNIGGTSFLGVQNVLFGGVPATSFTVVSTGDITAISPPRATPGFVDIQVVTPAGTSSATSADRFQYLAIVTGVSPNSGSLDGGTLVTLTGGGFGGPSIKTPFYFGSASISTYCASTTQCQVLTPPSAPGVVDVTVGQPGWPNSGDQYRYLGTTVTGISPTTGSQRGGDPVTIFGFGLSSGMIVKFGNVPTNGVSCNGDTWCDVISPPGSGSVHITVTINNATSAPTSADVFKYEPLPYGTLTPSSALAGTTVTVTGGNFTTVPGAVTFNFGAAPATNVVCVPTNSGIKLGLPNPTYSGQCSMTVPPYGGTGAMGNPLVLVRATVGGLTGPIADFTYQFPPPPPSPPPPPPPPTKPPKCIGVCQ